MRQTPLLMIEEFLIRVEIGNPEFTGYVGLVPKRNFFTDYEKNLGNL